MIAYYVDTSVLVKRYLNEAGSVWIRALMDPALQALIIISHYNIFPQRVVLFLRATSRTACRFRISATS